MLVGYFTVCRGNMKYKTVKYWGIFMKNDKNKSGHNRTPLVYCHRENDAKKMIEDKDHIHFNPKYKAGYIIKEITQKVEIPEWTRH
tara:strand:- start:225 stop:482 length:258 start_codon:yes stop_codon:yes gene_type:complete